MCLKYRHQSLIDKRGFAGAAYAAYANYAAQREYCVHMLEIVAAGADQFQCFTIAAAALSGGFVGVGKT